MDKDIIKPITKNKNGRLTFYIFEISAASLIFILFISGIVVAAVSKSFLVFLEFTLIGIVFALILFALGRLIDLNYVKAESKCDCGPECDCNKEEK